jgi:hypothetical protein
MKMFTCGVWRNNSLLSGDLATIYEGRRKFWSSAEQIPE